MTAGKHVKYLIVISCDVSNDTRGVKFLLEESTFNGLDVVEGRYQ